MPNELWEDFNGGLRLLISNGYDINGFINKLEAARQSTIQEGVFN